MLAVERENASLFLVETQQKIKQFIVGNQNLKNYKWYDFFFGKKRYLIIFYVNNIIYKMGTFKRYKRTLSIYMYIKTIHCDLYRKKANIMWCIKRVRVKTEKKGRAGRILTRKKG